MKKLLVVFLALITMLSLVCCTGNETEKEESSSSDIESLESTESSADTEDEETEETEESEVIIGMIYPEDGARVVLANNEVHTWWNTYKFGKTDSSPYYRHEDIYYPNSLTFSWEADEAADYYRLFISTDKDFAADKTESYLVNTNSLTLSHLYTGTKYYWFVLYTELTEDGGEFNMSSVHTRSFITEEDPRFFKIDGVSNTRDIGGFETTNGCRVKQGMIYRGGKLEGITEEGKEYFRNVIGITTDLDLRTPGEGGAGSGSPLGADINYVNINGRYYVGGMGINTEEGKAVFAQEIRVFANPDNYPIYIHCSLGRDRTGTLAMVIEGLLGVKFNDLMKDYEVSIFSVTGTLDNASIDAIRNNIKQTYDYISSNYEGDSFAEKTENYLLSIGITPEEIQSIRDIMLEEVK
jgi:protein-tyrosine phosphatase